MNIQFVKEYLTNVKWNNNQTWQIEGNIKKLSNQYYKFDISFLKDFTEKKINLLILKVRQIRSYLKMIKIGY